MFAQIVNPELEQQVAYLDFVQPGVDGAEVETTLTKYVQKYMEKRYGKKVDADQFMEMLEDDEDDTVTTTVQDAMYKQFGDVKINYRGDGEDPNILKLRAHVAKIKKPELDRALDNLAKDSATRDYLEYPEYIATYLGGQSPETFNSHAQNWYATLANGQKVEKVVSRNSKEGRLVLGDVEEDSGAANLALKLDWIAEEIEKPDDKKRVLAYVAGMSGTEFCEDKPCMKKPSVANTCELPAVEE